MLHVRRGADRFLDGIDDALFDIHGRGAFVDDSDKDDRYRDVGEQVHGKALQRGDAQHHHGEGQHQDADAVSKRKKR